MQYIQIWKGAKEREEEKRKEDISPSTLTKGQNLIIYGQIINHPEAYYDELRKLK